MATFLMFGKYSEESIRKIRPERTDKTVKLIEKYGGKLNGGYAMLGEKDLVLIVELPGQDEAMKLSVALSKMLGIGFSTAPAVTLEEFDKLVEDV